VYLLRHSAELAPDLVVIFVNQSDTERELPGLVVDGAVGEPRAQPLTDVGGTGAVYQAPDAAPFPVLEHSLLFSQLYYLWIVGKMRLELRYKYGAPFEWREFLDRDAPKVERSRARATLVLKKIAELSRARKFPLLVVNIDPAESLGYMGRIDPAIRYFDLSRALSEESQRHNLRFDYDRHFNARTHRFIADRIIPLF
jgi:hypothetical protein